MADEDSKFKKLEPKPDDIATPQQGQNSPFPDLFQIDLEEPESSFVEKEISVLQPQVETINRTPVEQAMSSNQVEVLRKYITLKETESQDLKVQQKQYQTQVKKLAAQLHSMVQKHQDVVTELETLKRKDSSANHQVRELSQQHKEEIARLKNEYEDQIRRSANVSQELQELQRKREEWKDKVQGDLKRIKLKERELENKYELLKRDTQALLDSKDKHVLELKRKNDALELEMESLEERLRNATLVVSSIQAKKRRLVETLRLALTLLEQMDAVEADESEKKAG